MLKITAVISLILIATWSHADSRRYKKDTADSRGYESGEGSTMWAASLSCDSCGSECASACGTRHFRSCCFNYLRRKRGPDAGKLLSTSRDFKPMESSLKEKARHPVYMVDSIPDQWAGAYEFRPYPIDDTIENRLYDF